MKNRISKKHIQLIWLLVFSQITLGSTNSFANSSTQEQEFDTQPAGGDSLIRELPESKFVMGEEGTTETQYPAAAVLQRNQQLSSEISKLREKKEALENATEEYEKKKLDALVEIQKFENQIRDSRLQQVNLSGEEESIKNELVQILSDREKIQQDNQTIASSMEKILQTHRTRKSEFAASKAALEQELKEFQNSKKKYDFKMNEMQIAMERMVTEKSRTEIESSKINNQKIRLQADLSRRDEEMAELSNQLSIAKHQKDEAANELKDLDKNARRIKSQLASSKNEFGALQKEKGALLSSNDRQRTQSLLELKRLETQIVENESARAVLLAEKARGEAEMRQYAESLASAQALHEKNLISLQADRDVVLESRLNIEKSKSEVAKLQNQDVKSKLDNENLKIKVRHLASMAAASGMSEDPVDFWKVITTCFMHQQPHIESPKSGKMQAGRNIAGQMENGFVKVLNSSGKPLYLDKKCVEKSEDR